MGEVVRYECEKCGYRFRLGLGVGGSFFIETVIKVENGEFGEEAKRFFNEHSDEAIEALVEFQEEHFRQIGRAHV